MNIALWIVQVLLAIGFFAAGMMKLVVPVDQLAQSGANWMVEMPWLVKFIGISDVAGGLAMILPAATRIKPILTPIAAIGLATIMVLAAGYHGMRGEFKEIGTVVILFAMAAFVAWGRLKKVPIQ